MNSIAMGFSNTVDFELEWDAAHLESLIRRTGLEAWELECKQQILSLKDLLCSILYHIREGSGYGMMVEDPTIIDQFVDGMRYRVTLGGTNIRAAEVISKLGGSSYVHLASVNSETLELMPSGTKWSGGEKFRCCYPHIALQYPANARICAGSIDIVAPRPNRLLYSGDIACVGMEFSPEFFANLRGSKILVMSGFDMMPDRQILTDRLHTLAQYLDTMEEPRPVVFYEDGCFADPSQWELTRNALKDRIDIYSMNEDELQMLCGRQIDLLDAQQVLDALRDARKILTKPTIVVHTRHYVLGYGPWAKDVECGMECGMAVASTRYRCGDVSPELIGELANLPLQARSVEFAREIEEKCSEIRCLPAREIDSANVTTVGLGDSFVGGFALAYSRKLEMQQEG